MRICVVVCVFLLSVIGRCDGHLHQFHSRILDLEREYGLSELQQLHSRGELSDVDQRQLSSVNGLREIGRSRRQGRVVPVPSPNACPTFSSTSSTPPPPPSQFSNSRYYSSVQFSSSSPSSSPLPLQSEGESGVLECRYFQMLDHFNSQDNRTFVQRYFMNMQYYVPGGPIFVYIGAESALSNYTLASGEIVENARTHRAAIIGLEHRFYGKSHPFSTLATDNLKYLSSQQALADLTAFLGFMGTYLGWGGQPIVMWGGSYGGSLSAWFRLKFPQLSIAAVASSAPLLAVASFYEYDQSVSLLAGENCAAAIRKATAEVVSRLDTDATGTMKQFGCDGLDVTDKVGFLYVIADVVAYAIQYSSDRIGPRHHLRQSLCDYMEDRSVDPFFSYVSFVLKLFGSLQTTCSDFSSDLNSLLNVSTHPSLNQRQWFYQSCSEFGWFQTAPQVNSLRSDRITLQYHIDLCQRVFGFPLLPTIEFTNKYYGANSPRGSRILFPSGTADPWFSLGYLNSQSCCPTQLPVIINGTSHCSDLYPADPSDPPSLVQGRAVIASTISFWLNSSESAAILCPSYLTLCHGLCIDTASNPRHCGTCDHIVSDINAEVCLNGEVTPVIHQSVLGQELLAVSGAFLIIGLFTLIGGLRAYIRARKYHSSNTVINSVFEPTNPNHTLLYFN